MKKMVSSHLFIAIGLALFAFFFYAPTLSFQFLALDDDVYVTANPIVLQGLTWQGLVWAFSDMHFGYWIPMTWVSYMMDVEVFGLNAWGFRLTNLLLFSANIALIFWILVKLTGEIIPSALVALLFCVHPMRVESVVWIAERKDVLSGLCWFLAMAIYIRFVRNLRLGTMLAVAATMLLGLMAKPILVVLPFALLLLDVWPLKRIAVDDTRLFWKQLWSCLCEKWLLLLLSGVFALLTIISQSSEGAVVSLDRYPLWQRLLVIPANYLFYLDKTIWPTGLAALYADRRLTLGASLFALAIMAALTVWIFRNRGSHPYLLIGWLWFLGTLFPVNGIVRVGAVELADRFTYLPHIGLLMMLVWGIQSALPRSQQWILWGSVALMVISLSVVTQRYARHWQNNEMFFSRILSINNHFLAAGNYGKLLVDQGRHEEALTYFQRSLQHRPAHVATLLNYANTLVLLERHGEGVELFQRILSRDPQHSLAHNNLANALADIDPDTAEIHYLAALSSDPQYADAHYNYANLLNQQGRLVEAADHYRLAIREDPASSLARYNLVITLIQHGDRDGARAALGEWLRQEPGHSQAVALQRQLIP